MSRQARKYAESGIYHVMLRGINQQAIFEDDQDRQQFLQILQDCRARSAFQLYAYCLMGNHVHLLLRIYGEGLETVFKRIGGRYVYWYNMKYQRVGHLFQDRFKSEPVDSDNYFVMVLRYIHLNPVKAKLCKHPEDYRWSSYLDYLESNSQVDYDFALGMMALEEFKRYHNQANEDKCLEMSEPIRRGMTDEQARVLLKRYGHSSSVAEFQMLDEKRQVKAIQQTHAKGASIRQLSRLTGVSKGVVERWIKK